MQGRLCLSPNSQSQALVGYAVLVFSCLVASNPLAAACKELSEAAHRFLMVWALVTLGGGLGSPLYHLVPSRAACRKAAAPSTFQVKGEPAFPLKEQVCAQCLQLL